MTCLARSRDIDECQVLVDDQEHVRLYPIAQSIAHSIVRGLSSRQSDSGGWNDAGKVGGLPLLPVKFDARLVVHPAGNWPKSFDDDNEVPQVSEPVSRNTTPEDAVAFVHKGRTYGGFPVITWKAYRRYYANDLPLTSRTPRRITPRSTTCRTVDEWASFQALILETTVDEAWTISPWEFFHTNQM
jgi:hypothetical protein